MQLLQLVRTKVWPICSTLMPIKYPWAFGFPGGHRKTSHAAFPCMLQIRKVQLQLSWRSSKSPSLMYDSAELVNWHSLLINMQQQLPLYRSSASAGLWDQLPCHLPNSTSTSKQSAEKSGKVTKPFAHPKIPSRVISKAAWASGNIFYCGILST